MPRRFHKTVIQIEILSEDPYPDGKSLQDIAYDIEDGEYSGRIHRVSSEELDGPAMADALEKQGSDPEFFRLDQDGVDLHGDDNEPDSIPAALDEIDSPSQISADGQRLTEACARPRSRGFGPGCG